MAHIVQSPEWGKFKTAMGTPAVQVGEIQYTKHKVPFSSFYYGYSPKVDPTKIDWAKLEASLTENNCVAVNFDVPNVIVGSPEAESAVKLLESKCKKSPRDTFAKSNVIMDISPSEEEILSGMHKKHRYNIKYAERNGVTVYEANDQADFDIFYSLLEETAEREKYYIHSKAYYQTIWEQFSEKGLCHILIAKHEETPLSAWMLFTYDNTLYYPYGASANQGRNLMASNLIAWEAIKLGKKSGCTMFDIWGAAVNPENEDDPYYGFTNFKLKFGGKHVTYIDSYDFVVNETAYTLFNTANDLRWKVLKLLK